MTTEDVALRKLAKRFCEMYGGDVVRDGTMKTGRVDEWLMFTWFKRAADHAPPPALRIVTTANPAADPTQVFIVDGKLMTPEEEKR